MWLDGAHLARGMRRPGHASDGFLTASDSLDKAVTSLVTSHPDLCLVSANRSDRSLFNMSEPLAGGLDMLSSWLTASGEWDRTQGHVQ